MQMLKERETVSHAKHEYRPLAPCKGTRRLVGVSRLTKAQSKHIS